MARPLKTLILYAHPEPTSFSAALKETAVEVLSAHGEVVTVSDLHRQNFNPAAGRHDFKTIADPQRFHYQTEQLHATQHHGFADDLAEEQKKFLDADRIVMIFPLWWGGPPAILKGWIDRVLACGIAYTDGARFTTGLHPSKQGLLCVSTGGTPERFREEDVYGPIDKVLWPLQHLTFDYMGMTSLPPFVAYAAPRVSNEQRSDYLQQWSRRLADLSHRSG
jgi:NAD(P)H dehydrogenase (quinone)